MARKAPSGLPFGERVRRLKTAAAGVRRAPHTDYRTGVCRTPATPSCFGTEDEKRKDPCSGADRSRKREGASKAVQRTRL